MELKTILDEFQKINKEGYQKDSKIARYETQVENPWVRNILVDIAYLTCCDPNGDTVRIQGVPITFDLRSGYIAYEEKDKTLPEKAFRCSYNHYEKSYDLILFANAKDELEDVLRKRIVLIRPDIIFNPEDILPSKERYYGSTFISRQMKKVNINDAY